MKTTIIITGQLDTSTAFGVCMTTGEKVFVPAAVARPINVTVNGEYEAIVMENVAQRREQAQLRAVKLFGEPAVLEEPDDAVTDDEVLELIAEDINTSAYQVAHYFYDKPLNSEKAEIEAILERLASAGRIAKAVISMGPLFEVRYAMTPDAFKSGRAAQ